VINPISKGFIALSFMVSAGMTLVGSNAKLRWATCVALPMRREGIMGRRLRSIGVVLVVAGSMAAGVVLPSGAALAGTSSVKCLSLDGPDGPNGVLTENPSFLGCSDVEETGGGGTINVPVEYGITWNNGDVSTVTYHGGGAISTKHCAVVTGYTLAGADSFIGKITNGLLEGSKVDFKACLYNGAPYGWVQSPKGSKIEL
jgi:hypothetical protein